MTQLVFSAVGGLLSGPLGLVKGGLGGVVLDGLETQVANRLGPARQVGPRIEALKVQGSAEGQGLACVFGRGRVAGHVIWAARFLENKRKQSAGKGAKTYDYAYSLSFAVGLGEGEIDGIGRIWADGMAMDLSGVTYRVYRGSEDQMPDPLIEAVEGVAPAYRGTAYVVFEDLPLEDYGNRVPQLSFEVFRRARGRRQRLEDQLQGVCLIPGAGEFVLAGEVVKRRLGLTKSAMENSASGQARADLDVSLDQLTMQLPNVRRVNLVIGWFGTSLNAHECQVRPGVELREKVTEPQAWQVAGLEREDAHLVSTLAEGDPAYGGTPSDESVRQAIRALRARGLEVVLYPFVFMDCEGYPWRGRLTGRAGIQAPADVQTVFGSEHGWGLRRQVLHYARMAREESAQGLIIGSEMRALTGLRDGQGGFPAVQAYRALAAECRSVAGSGVKLGYAADWSEYSGIRDGGDVRFHLDALWADENIDFVGIDWYPPMGDWRAGDGGRDAEGGYSGPWDREYLAGQIAGGRDFDWYYADGADEAQQLRTPIADGAYGEHWVWRAKDLKGWWSNVHYDRTGGVRHVEPTPWIAGMKPVRLVEFGCAAVDRGGNAPNLFFDPKSSESALPPHSTGARDDRMQRAVLEAVLGHFALPQNNPVSAVYDRPMLDGADAWCWDARPYPAFPARGDIWADAGAWRTGHWLNGRMQGQAADIVEALLARAGLSGGYLVEGLEQSLTGIFLDRPMSTRAALGAILPALGAVATERGGAVVVSGGALPSAHLREEALALDDEGQSVVRQRELQTQTQAVRVRFVLEGGDYQTAAVMVRAEMPDGSIPNAAPLNDVVDYDWPCVASEVLAREVAQRLLKEARSETRKISLGPLEALQIEVGDVVTLEGEAGLWRVAEVDYAEVTTAQLSQVNLIVVGDYPEDWRGSEGVSVVGAPWVRVLDLPPLAGSEEDARPVVAAAADPWRPMVVFAGAQADSLGQRAVVEESATVGMLTQPLRAGVVDRWDRVNSLQLIVEGQMPQSQAEAAVLDGGNLLAVETEAGWELLRYRSATLLQNGQWRLEGLLRGQGGTEVQAWLGADRGASVVWVDGALARAEVMQDEQGVERLWRVGPRGLPPQENGFGQVRFAWRGRSNCPWAPVHIRARHTDAGISLSWAGRSRIGGDRWDQDESGVDEARYRIRIMRDGHEIRQWIVQSEQSVYVQAHYEADFATEPAGGASVLISQWGSKWGWGEEGVCTLP